MYARGENTTYQLFVEVAFSPLAYIFFLKFCFIKCETKFFFYIYVKIHINKEMYATGENVTSQNTPKRSYIKSGKYTKENILRRKINTLINKFKRKYKNESNWHEKLKEAITDLVFKSNISFKLDKKALGVVKRYVMDLKKVGLSLYSPLKLFEKVKPLLMRKFKNNVMTKHQLTFQCKMTKMNPATGEIEIKEPHFHSKQHQILEGNDFNEIYQKMQDEINYKFEKWIDEGSQWNFEFSLKLILNISKIKILNGSSYIPLPKKLLLKKAIVNPKNEDQKCFLWCVGIHQLLKENPDLINTERITKH